MAGGGGEFAEGKKELIAVVENLGKGGANLRVSGIFFKAAVQAVLLFRFETSVMTPRMCRPLGGFQLRVSIPITGRHPWRLLGGIWEYPLLEMAMQEAVFEKVEEYVLRRKNVLLCNATNCGSLRGDGADAGDMVCKKVVGAEGTGFGGIVGGGGSSIREGVGIRDGGRIGVSNR